MLTVRSTADRCAMRGSRMKFSERFTWGETRLNTLIQASPTANEVSTMISTDQGSPWSPLEASKLPLDAETVETT